MKWQKKGSRVCGYYMVEARRAEKKFRRFQKNLIGREIIKYLWEFLDSYHGLPPVSEKCADLFCSTSGGTL